MTLDPSQFELGEDVTAQFEPPTKKKSGIVVSVRLSPEDADELLSLSEKTDRTVSQVAREAIRRYLAGTSHPAVLGGPTVMVRDFGSVVSLQYSVKFVLDERTQFDDRGPNYA